MWVVRPVEGNVVAAVVAWLRGREAIYVYGTAEAAQAAADHMNKGPLAQAGAAWTIAELPGLLVEVVDELRDQVRLVESAVARMREAGAVALWPAPEPEGPAEAEKKSLN